jgi:DNA-binding NarL/FixJ family response regulator
MQMRPGEEGGDVATDSGKPVRVMVVDDHELVRAGISGLLADEAGIQVVGEASNGREAVDLCARLRPELVLMDVRMPEMDGLAATRAIKEVQPETAVIIVTMHESADYLYEALKAGAAGYVLKDARREELVSAVRTVQRGETILNADLASQLLRRMAGEVKQPAQAPTSLTPREVEVVRLLAQGKTNRQIADELVVSPSTVKAHVEHIIAKLNVSDRTQAAVRAVELGLLKAG